MTNYSLTRRYWISLVGLTSSAVLDGYSLWSRYWATLLGSPPRPGAAGSTQTNGATASLVIPDVPRKRMRARKGLVAAAAVTTAITATFTGPLISHHAHNAPKPLAAASESFPPVRLDDCPTLLTRYQGRCVAQLQADLNVIQGSTLVVDGNFGSVGSPTYNAVIAFQKAHGLPQDGMVGPDMKKALAAALSASSVPRSRP
jgi:Putative peptidoglycan binding domain